MDKVEESNVENAEDFDSNFVQNMYSLSVKLLEGHDLVIRDSSGTSDPFVKFKYNGKTLFKSQIIHKNLNPIWNETFTTTMIMDLNRPIKIVVKDFDRFSVNDYMGEALLHLSSLDLSKTHQMKIVLQDGDKPSSNHYMGYLLLEVLVTAPVRHSIEDFVEVESSFTDLKSLKRTPSKPKRQKRKDRTKSLAAVIHIVVCKAKRLLHTDTNASSPLPNPFVQIKFGSQKLTTEPADRTLDPKWYEEFELYLYDDIVDKHIELCVTDKRKNICMGKCLLDINHFEREITHRRWADLGDGAGSIFYLLTINTPSSSDTVKDMLIDTSTFEDTSRYALSKSLSDVRDVGHLIVKVFKAQGLASADINGKSDPFCIVELINSRLETHTVYNTLNPEWNKMFTFQVKDIHSVVEITIMDEDSNGQEDFLGKIALPLINLKNNEKQWYALKNKKLNQRVKGQILLEFELYYNPVRAIYRTFKPKEQKYIGHEKKFKRSVMVKNLLRLKVFTPNTNLPDYVVHCLSWETPAFSAVAFVVSLLFTYYFQLYMVPLGVLILLLKNYIHQSINKGITSSSGNYLEPEKEEEELLDGYKDDNLSFKERWNEIQEGLVMMQDLLGYTASYLERIKNCLNFSKPFLSWLAVVLMAVLTVILYFVPFRYLVMIYLIKRFTKALRTPHSVPNTELIDFLSRIPSDEELKLYGEFRPETVLPRSKDSAKKAFSFRTPSK